MKILSFKSVLFLMLVGIVVAASCKKKNENPPVKPVSHVSDLKAVRHRTRYDTGGVYAFPLVMWYFTGANPTIATPNLDTAYFGHQEAFYSDTNIVRYRYNMGSRGTLSYCGLTADVKYKTGGLIDTISFAYDIHSFGAEKLVFKYDGNKISRVDVARWNPNADTFYWATPDVYTFTYTGNNISRITMKPMGSATTDTFYYASSSVPNNLAGSFSTFLNVFFLVNSSVYINDILLQMPFYINANLPHPAGSTTTIVDTKGRLIELIYNSGIPGADTVFFYYN